MKNMKIIAIISFFIISTLGLTGCELPIQKHKMATPIVTTDNTKNDINSIKETSNVDTSDNKNKEEGKTVAIPDADLDFKYAKQLQDQSYETFNKLNKISTALESAKDTEEWKNNTVKIIDETSTYLNDLKTKQYYVPSKYKEVHKLYIESLNEYYNGLTTIKSGIEQINTDKINEGVAEVNKSGISLNKVNELLKSIN